MKRLLRLALLATTLTALAGCARVTVNTNLSADGSFKRTVKYAVASMGPADANSPMASPANLFAIPKPGPGVTVTPGTEAGMKTVTVATSAPAGSGPVNDIVVVDAATKTPAITGSVTVTKLPDGNLEYTETLHALKHFSMAITKPDSGIRTSIKSALPERFQTTATIDKVTMSVANAFIHVLFGPPEPFVAEAMIDPDLMVHKIKAVTKKTLSEAMKQAMPGITDEELTGAINKLTSASGIEKSFGDSPADSNSDPTELMPLTFTTTYPGKLVRTNGIVDEDSGEVYWSMLAPTLEFGDVKLSLVVDPSNK